jgi:NADH-quinone oxidoreductase subunit K
MEAAIPIHWSLSLSAVIFTIGVVGVLTRRNMIQVFMALELMLNAVNINLVAFSEYLESLTGQIFVLFVITVAAAEAAMALAIIVAFYRNKQTLNVDEFNLLKW